MLNITLAFICFYLAGVLLWWATYEHKSHGKNPGYAVAARDAAFFFPILLTLTLILWVRKKAEK